MTFYRFEPSNRYYESSLTENINNASREEKGNKGGVLDRYERFGNVALTGSGYGNTGGGGAPGYGPSYVPTKIDIGGVALGALLGLGAILLVPKLTAFMNMGYHGYRSKSNTFFISPHHFCYLFLFPSSPLFL